MKRDVRDKWTAALRSGEYTQGKGSLKTKVGDQTWHCCLGVLCELAAEAGVCTIDTNDAGFIFFDHEYGTLPLSVMEWSGIDSVAGGFGPGIRDTLAMRNDEGDTFAQIADLIEEHF